MFVKSGGGFPQLLVAYYQGLFYFSFIRDFEKKQDLLLYFIIYQFRVEDFLIFFPFLYVSVLGIVVINFTFVFRYLQLLGLVPTDPGILQKMGEMFDAEGDKQQAYQYHTEVSESQN